jgi:hypothetical protein
MMKRRSGDRAVKTTFMGVIAMALCGGCVPIDGAELETFVRELLLNAAAAFLL